MGSEMCIRDSNNNPLLRSPLMGAFRISSCNGFLRLLFLLFVDKAVCFVPVDHDGKEKKNHLKLYRNQILNAPMCNYDLNINKHVEIGCKLGLEFVF